MERIPSISVCVSNQLFAEIFLVPQIGGRSALANLVYAAALDNVSHADAISLSILHVDFAVSRIAIGRSSAIQHYSHHNVSGCVVERIDI